MRAKCAAERPLVGVNSPVEFERRMLHPASAEIAADFFGVVDSLRVTVDQIEAGKGLVAEVALETRLLPLLQVEPLHVLVVEMVLAGKKKRI